jgi:hypothetical protein
MFCPSCGREDSQGRKFCSACGANLERVTRALSSGGDNFLVRADQAFDRLIARYAGLFFSGARDKATDWRVSQSWTLWAQSLLALPLNFILLYLLLFIIPIRLFTLLLGSPFRLLSERSDRQDAASAAKEAHMDGYGLLLGAAAKEENKRAQLQAPPPEQWSLSSGPSVVEHTTKNLPDTAATERKS